MTARTAYTAGKDTQLTCRKLSLNLDYAFDWASSWGMLFSAEKSEHLQIVPKTQNLNQSDVFMHGSYIPRVTTHKHWAFVSTAACPGKTTLIMCTPTVPGRLAFCTAYNVSSGQQLLEDLHRSISDHGSSMPSPCEAGEITASWSSSKNCSAAGTRLSYLNCNSDLTITHWCCSSRSSRTWPLLIWQSVCHNSLPTVVIIFEKICIPSLL